MKSKLAELKIHVEKIEDLHENRKLHNAYGYYIDSRWIDFRNPAMLTQKTPSSFQPIDKT